jgi:putative ABC transport system permease protein
MLFGVTTAFHIRRVDLHQVLKETGRMIAPARGRLRNALVSVQITLALILLVCAGLTIQGFNRLSNAYQGFQPAHVFKFEVGLPDGTYPNSGQAVNFFQIALRSVSDLPGVSGAALASNLPASNVESERTMFTIEGRPAASASEAPAADLQIVSGAYFDVLKIPIVAGRFFGDSDNAASARVVMINQSMAIRFWPSGDALGKRFKLGAADSPEPWATVVGIVGDARQNWWQSTTLPVIYQPYLQSSRRQLDFVMRVDTNTAVYASAVPSLFSHLNPEIAVTEMNSLQTEVNDSIAIVRIMGILMEVFGLIALLLASIGLYGILSQNVVQRTREFGIRFALGAHPHDVLYLVFRHALILAGFGIAIGLPLAFAASHALATLIFGIVAVNTPMLLGLASVLLVVALIAAYVPARRGFHTDPMTALRYE